MQSKRRRTPTAVRKRKRAKGKARSPADPNERLKPISLQGMDFDEVIRRLVAPRK